MRVVIDGYSYCRKFRVAPNTLIRRLNERMIFDVEHRGCRVWRLSTRPQTESMGIEANHVFVIGRSD